MYDFDRFPPRGIVRADTKWIDGIPLEAIPTSPSQFARAMILIHRNWDDVYFVAERVDWTDDQYFEYAARRFKDLGIKNP